MECVAVVAVSGPWGAIGTVVILLMVILDDLMSCRSRWFALLPPQHGLASNHVLPLRFGMSPEKGQSLYVSFGAEAVMAEHRAMGGL